MSTRGALGRPPVTTHAAIEEAAFALFEDRGFETTTMDDIAAAVGVGRRTLFRYYPSKNDILWGQFDQGLADFEKYFQQAPASGPIATTIQQAIIAFNRLPAAAVPQHRRRMTLLLSTPALLGHSELRYAAWRDVIARFVAERRGEHPTDTVPATAGRVSLALSISAYEQWLRHPEHDLEQLFHHVFDALGDTFALQQ
ncbi:mycofactocin system transcriptional regulator [Nocardioides sp. zg-579]|uniref:Mycofactocin system transcriptional regulator n=1 Tax=Nocardioides marmotae TaxID=2663857 RepID=A0A6I3J3W1_9ACTN|nr:mycofactocin system transcriptional regulator [Nocardioides marmotae]MCR6030121.1 mycofactocin system transcriptional regulator [Gordonia jinghuaiqii]MTB93752.1 mycofactocin system transcriptional regulator [Nocardioides marmotae]